MTDTHEETLVLVTVKYKRPMASGSKLYTKSHYVIADDPCDAICTAVANVQDMSTDFELLGVDCDIREDKLLVVDE